MLSASFSVCETAFQPAARRFPGWDILGLGSSTMDIMLEWMLNLLLSCVEDARVAVPDFVELDTYLPAYLAEPVCLHLPDCI